MRRFRAKKQQSSPRTAQLSMAAEHEGPAPSIRSTRALQWRPTKVARRATRAVARRGVMHVSGLQQEVAWFQSQTTGGARATPADSEVSNTGELFGARVHELGKGLRGDSGATRSNLTPAF